MNSETSSVFQPQTSHIPRFHILADLSVFKFRPASTRYGQVCVSVTHDVNLSQFGCPDANYSDPVPRKNLSSPYPSPKVARKMLSFSQASFERQTNAKKQFLTKHASDDCIDTSRVFFDDATEAKIFERTTSSTSLHGFENDSKDQIMDDPSVFSTDHILVDEINASGKHLHSIILGEQTVYDDELMGNYESASEPQSFTSSNSRPQLLIETQSSNTHSYEMRSALPPLPRPAPLLRSPRSLLYQSITRSSSSSSIDGLGRDSVSDETARGLSGLRIDVPEPIEIRTQRRVSISTPTSELFGSFVGSYETSILSGKMSTTPSRPLTFLAEIGVIGFGKCKPHLKCPPHLTVPFKAYFYELNDEESPTPYVGTIELESGIDHYENESPLSSIPMPNHISSSKGYRIPFKGQLQIVN